MQIFQKKDHFKIFKKIYLSISEKERGQGEEQRERDKQTPHWC